MDGPDDADVTVLFEELRTKPPPFLILALLPQLLEGGNMIRR